MAFDESRYVQEFIRRQRGAHTLPDDLLARYAITLPATDAEVAAQLKAVRAYWNKTFQGKSNLAQVAKMCRAEDERLRAQHGPSMETRSWWEKQQAQRRSAAQAAIAALAGELRQAYGSLGVVTTGIVERYAAKLGLAEADAAEAVAQAGLRLAGAVAIPDAEPIPSFAALRANLAECGANTVPELLHPGSGPYRLLERYTCLADTNKRLDAVAVSGQMAEVDKRGASATDNARGAALKMLRSALNNGVDLRDVALYHVVCVGRENTQLSPTMAANEMHKLGLDRGEASVLAVVLAEQGVASGAVGLDKVRQLLATGRLNEARQAALSLPAEFDARADAIKEVDEARGRLDALVAEAARAVAAHDEARAAALLREAAAISAEDAEAAMAAVPPAPPAEPRAVCDGAQVKLFWRPAPGHDDGVTYVVTRTGQRPAAGPGDGAVVYRGRDAACVDEAAPVARPTHYCVFALVDGRPSSRPAAVIVTLVPPVSRLGADVGPSQVTAHWTAHPAAQEVVVTRTIPGPPARLPVTGSSCHLPGLAEGQAVHLEIVAVYRGLDGGELHSPPAHLDATPRSEASPLPKLRARPIESGGAVRVRVSWTPVDSSQVRVLRSAEPPPWEFGTWITPEQMAGFGTEVTGRRVSGRAEVGVEADLPPGVHHLVPLSVGGTGIVVGRSAMVGVTDPVRRLVVTPFADHATLSWEWPSTSQLAEVSWELDGDADSVLIGLAEYRTQGGARVPLGRGPCSVEVRAVLMAGGMRFTSPPVPAVIDSVVDVAVAYTVSSSPGVGPFGGRTKKVVFTCAEGCQQVHVRMVAAPGRVMPTSAEAGVVILDTALSLQPGVPAEHTVTVPRPVKRPYWVRCFVVGGRARLLDPPITSLKES